MKAKAKVPGVAAAKHIRALIQSQAEREKAQLARLDLRKKMRDHKAALQIRADTERLRGLRGDTPRVGPSSARHGTASSSAQGIQHTQATLPTTAVESVESPHGG